MLYDFILNKINK